LDVAEEYSQVVKSHMTIISALPGFIAPAICQQVETPEDHDGVTWVIRYFADSREAIQHYFDTLAPELRQHTTQYAEKVQASRRILHTASMFA
jgi:heme-degrading monooxygenase HmoA